MSDKAFWLLAAVIGVQLFIVVATVAACLSHAESLLAAGKACLTNDAREGLFTLLASALATALAVYSAKKGDDK